MPYYLWALPGDKTPWYYSVTLYRQENFGDWTKPFDGIKNDLAEIAKKLQKIAKKGILIK